MAIAVGSSFALSACDGQRGASGGAATSSEEVRSQIDSLESKVTELAGRLNSVEVALLDCSSAGYDQVNTPMATFLVACDDATPYLNGFKLNLRIGNLTMATFSAPELRLRWAAELLDFIRDSGSTAVGHTSAKLTTDLRPGSWTKATVVVAPATPEQMKNIELRLVVDMVTLARP